MRVLICGNEKCCQPVIIQHPINAKMWRKYKGNGSALTPGGSCHHCGRWRYDLSLDEIRDNHIMNVPFEHSLAQTMRSARKAYMEPKNLWNVEIEGPAPNADAEAIVKLKEENTVLQDRISRLEELNERINSLEALNDAVDETLKDEAPEPAKPQPKAKVTGKGKKKQIKFIEPKKDIPTSQDSFDDLDIDSLPSPDQELAESVPADSLDPL